MTSTRADVLDWIADRRGLLVPAWTADFAIAPGWSIPYAEALATEFPEGMVSGLLVGGAFEAFLRSVTADAPGAARSEESAFADRFYTVTLKLARAAVRRNTRHATRAAFPYLRAFTAGDACVGAGHLALEGIVLPQDHPFWRRWHPPLAMDCRCGTVQESARQQAQAGGRLTSEADLASRARLLKDEWPAGFLPLLDFRH